MTLPTLERRRELVATDVTLNGKRAVISGSFLPFARVSAVPDGPRYEYAWETVEHVVSNRRGAFVA